MGNYKDELMEQLADKGNGNNFYIDSLDQAKRVFHEDLTANLEVVAKDVKLQVDFDPAMVARYRLVGYENRDIKDDDFRDDKVDAGEIGAGHQVTALYEVELTAKGKQAHAPIGAIRIRHKTPNGAKATEAAFPMVGGPAASFANSSTGLPVRVRGRPRSPTSCAAARMPSTGRSRRSATWRRTPRVTTPSARSSSRLIEKAIEIKGRTASR